MPYKPKVGDYITTSNDVSASRSLKVGCFPIPITESLVIDIVHPVVLNHKIPLRGDKARSFHRIKIEKDRKGKSLCVLGKDVSIDMVQGLSYSDLMGKFEYIKMSRMEVVDHDQPYLEAFD